MPKNSKIKEAFIKGFNKEAQSGEKGMGMGMQEGPFTETEGMDMGMGDMGAMAASTIPHLFTSNPATRVALDSFGEGYFMNKGGNFDSVGYRLDK